MIAEQQNTDGLVLNGPMRTQKLGVRNFGKMAGILQDTLYTDKELAPIREYSTNAADAHVEAGCPDRPIIVRLPNRFSPVLAIRDFGPGMDENRVWNIFCNYGESTKDTSNDEVGMFGIGSKSAFAYAKSFTVISFRDGIRSSYVCHTGGCKEGEFVQLGSEPTTEENGLEIQVPVQVADIATFVTKAAKFFTYWRVTPIFEGNNIEILKTEMEFVGENWYLPKLTDRYSNSTNKPKFLMGNIAYDFPELSKLKPELFGVDTDEAYNINRMLELGLVLSAPIGSVDVAANRETLQLTDKTLGKIWEILLKIRGELAVIMDKAFDVLPTTYQKKQLRAKYNTYDHAYHRLAFLLSPKYANLTADYNLNAKRDERGFDVLLYGRSRRGARRVKLQRSYDYNIPCSDKSLCVEAVDGALNGNKTRNRVVALIERDTNQFKKSFSEVRVISVIDRVKFAAWCLSVGFDLPMVDLATLPEHKMGDFYPSMKKPSIRSINADKNCKRYLALDMSAKGNYSADYFQPVALPKKPSVAVPYIIIDKYQVISFGSDTSPSEAINCIAEICSVFGFKSPEKIVAVKKGFADSLDNKYFIPLSEWFVKQIENEEHFVEKLATLQLKTLSSFKSNSVIRHNGTSVNLNLVVVTEKLMNKLTVRDGLLVTTLTQMIELRERVNSVKSSHEGTISSFFGVSPIMTKIQVKVEATLGGWLNPFITNVLAMNTMYSMVSLMDDYVLRYLTAQGHEEQAEKLVNYINLVDESNVGKDKK